MARAAGAHSRWPNHEARARVAQAASSGIADRDERSVAATSIGRTEHGLAPRAAPQGSSHRVRDERYGTREAHKSEGSAFREVIPQGSSHRVCLALPAGAAKPRQPSDKVQSLFKIEAPVLIQAGKSPGRMGTLHTSFKPEPGFGATS